MFPEIYEVYIPKALCSRKSMSSISQNFYVPGRLWAPYSQSFMFPEVYELYIPKALRPRKSMTYISPKLYVPGVEFGV